MDLYTSIYPSIHLLCKRMLLLRMQLLNPTYRYIHIAIYLSLSIYASSSIYRPIYLSISVYLSIYLSIYLST